MSKLNVNIQGSTVKFSGNLDEEAQLPTLDLQPGMTVVLHMEEVKSVNSVGIRTWLTWITPLAETAKFVFERVPHPVVLQMNMIEGFLPKNAEVTSFFVPVFSEETDEEDEILLTVGKDIIKDPGGARLAVKVQELKGGGDWELDVTEKTYFKFLSR